MDKKVIGRREFLKLAAASAVAVGLSHFRILNFGGPGSTLAQATNRCNSSVPDLCNSTDPDICIEPKPGGQGDTCPDNSPGGADICAPGPGAGAEDLCTPPNEPNICDPQAEADVCSPPNDPDACEVLQTGPAPDTCMKAPDDVDICPDGPDGDGDLCNLQTDPHDTCEPYLQPPEPDICDQMRDPVDVCDPIDKPPDMGSAAVKVGSFGARRRTRSTSPALPVAGVVAVAAGAAVAWGLSRPRDVDKE